MLLAFEKSEIVISGRVQNRARKDPGNSRPVTSICGIEISFFSFCGIATKYDGTQKQFQQLLNLINLVFKYITVPVSTVFFLARFFYPRKSENSDFQKAKGRSEGKSVCDFLTGFIGKTVMFQFSK